MRIASPVRASRLAYQPALDGLRAVAVLAVLLFHGDVPGIHGGYVGVSVFFTLSGFLITTLLIREHEGTGRIAVGSFYARRARRLLPASALCLAGIVLLSALGGFDQVAHLRRDVIAAALQVFNWARVLGGTSYTDLFAQTGGQASPVEHYWSLAIEEQFYWVWPVVFVALAATASRLRRSVSAVLGVAAGAAIVAGPVVAMVWGPDAAYWATPARVGEILTGAVAAALVAERGPSRLAARLVPLCLALIAAACILLPADHGPAYQGWLPALSVVTAVLLWGLQSPGLGRTTLSWKPLVALGTISYGVYLFHWPIFVLVDKARLGHGGPILLAARLGLTLIAAVISHRLVERPIRLSSWAPRPTLVAGLALTATVVLIGLSLPTGGTVVDTAGAAGEKAAITGQRPTAPLRSSSASVPDSFATAAGAEAASRHLTVRAPVPSRPVRILVIGDSTAKAVGGGLARWAAAHPDLAQVTIDGAAGCGFVQGGVRVFPSGDSPIGANCDDYVDRDIGQRTADLQPDIVVAMTTAWDVLNQRFGSSEPMAPTEPEYGRRISQDLGAATELVLSQGAPRFVWIAEPTANPYWNPVHSPQEEVPRHEVLHGAMRRLAAADPSHVSVADLAWWIDAAGLATDRAARPDGVHLTAAAAQRVATDWLGPLLITTALAT